MKEMEKEFDKTPGLRSEFQSWMNMIQRELGPNLEKADGMTEEEINRISLPPPRLREVMDRLIPDPKPVKRLCLTIWKVSSFRQK